MLAEGLVPLQTVGQTLELLLRVGRVDIHQMKVRQLDTDDAPFVVMLGNAEAEHVRLKRRPGEHRGAGVALLHRGIPEHLVAFEPFQSRLMPLSLHFLQADDVGVALLGGSRADPCPCLRGRR